QIPAKTPDKPQALAGRALSYLELGHEAYERGEYDRARLLYEQVVSMSPDYYPAYYHLADVLCLQGKFEQAKANFDIFLAQYPRHNKALMGLMYCHLKTGELEQAKDILENKLNQINDKQQWDDLLEK
ncbi:MAG: tetratricopeptide repeat protein, partial [Sedimentisphaerales bacterium]|nr:tetratricopeptide repeat protein [Sedimentisphaerales bacterium]